MNTRINLNWKKPKVVATPVREEYELVTIIEPISFNEDKTIKEYKEIQKYVLKKSMWQDFIDSFDIGTPQDQVMNHILKGTPLITAHTLPSGDYTPSNLLKGAEIVREMREKGISLEMVEEALKVQASNESSAVANNVEKEVASNG